MIEEIRFNETDKKVDISIDNEHQQIPIYEVDKYQTFINLNKTLNTPLKENIIVDAYLYRVPYDTILNERQIKDENIIDTDGIVTITIYNNDKIYYQNNVSFKHGYIYDNITNKLQIGEYRAVIEYKGNKYFQPATLNITFNIEKRPVIVVFDDNVYYGNPSHTIQVTAKLIDNISHKTVPQCQVIYDFAGNTYASISNLNGELTLNVTIPEIDQSHCPTFSGNQNPDEEGAYPNASYILSLYSNDNSYAIYDGQTNIIANKIATSIAINSGGTVVNNSTIIEGPVIDANNEPVKYGSVYVRITDAENYKPATVPIDANGYFSIDVNFVDVYDFTSNIDEAEPYNLATNRPTSIKIIEEESKFDNIIVGDEIITSIRVIDETDRDNYVTDGMIVFMLFLNNNDTKELYRYATEIDSTGQAIFFFNTSRPETYKIKIKYYGLFGYQESENYIEGIEVTES